MLSLLKEKLRRVCLPAPYLTIEEVGFAIVDGEQTSHFAWDDLRQIRAWKVDCGTYDTIQIGLELAGGAWIEVDEGDVGYRQLVTALEARFELVEGWSCEVAFPAFAANLTILWTHRDYCAPSPR